MRLLVRANFVVCNIRDTYLEQRRSRNSDGCRNSTLRNSLWGEMRKIILYLDDDGRGVGIRVDSSANGSQACVDGTRLKQQRVAILFQI